MFSTLSFSKGSQSKAFEDHSFSHDGSGHSTRRFACEICRAHKIKCSGDKLSCARCARCASLNIKCVYDRVSKYGSRSSRSQPRQSIILAGTMKSSWSIHSPNKTSSSKHRRDKSSSTPRKEKDAIDDAGDDELLPNSKSPESDMAGSSSDGRTTVPTCTLGPLHYDDGDASMDIVTDVSTLGDLDNRLDWSLINDEYTPAPELISRNPAFDPSTIQLPDLSLSQPLEHSGPQQPSTLSSDSQPCSCSGRLSALLFSLNGHLRRPPGGSTIPLEQSISRILAAHASAARLRDNMSACVSQCLKQPSNAVQLVMLIEQLVDFYAELVEQLFAAQYADTVQRGSTTSAEVALAITLRIGEYVVENAAEKEAMIKLLVGGRIKALTKFTMTCQEQLGITSGAGECSGRLNTAMQRLEVLRDA